MKRLAIVARLKDGARDAAAALIAGGPPFDPRETRFDRHAVYLSAGEMVFVFEGPDVEAEVDDLVSDFFRPSVSDALDAWRPLLDGEPKYAREAYFWERLAPEDLPAPPSA